jgi:PTS system beta-glucosides-specific IIC component
MGGSGMGEQMHRKKYDKTASEIIRLVGGEGNITELIHCATRLRFTLGDSKQAHKAGLEQLPEVLTVVESGGQYQVVIGDRVPEVYLAIAEQIDVKDKSSEESDQPREKTKLTTRLFEIISASFSPLLPALAGSGMVKALLSILTTFGWLSDKSSTYAILAAASNAVFYFLPILLGITLATKLKATPYMGGVIGAALMEPNFAGLLSSSVDRTSFLGIPVVLSDYASTVFPVFIAVSIFTVLEKNLKKFMPKSVQLFLVPMLSLIIVVPLTVIALGPFGVYVSEAIANGINFLMGHSGVIAGVVVGGFIPFLVVLGVHWGLVPIILLNISELGRDPIIGIWSAATFAQIGIALGVFLKTKDRTLKAAAGSSTLTGLLAGVTEPILYGIVLRYKRLLPLMIGAGAVGGGILGFFNVAATSFILQSVFAFGAYDQIGYAIFGSFVSLVLGTILVLVFGYGESKSAETISGDSEAQANSANSSPASVLTETGVGKKEIVGSPISGTIKALAEVDDPAFAVEAMGKGIAIVPKEGRVYAPFNGFIATTFPSKHALGLVSTQGAEMLVHVGLNTVKLKGQHFTLHVKEGDTVKKGQLLLEFDIEAIQKAGFDITTPIIVTNTGAYSSVLPAATGLVVSSSPLLTLEA